jgi:hypothetical protein
MVMGTDVSKILASPVRGIPLPPGRQRRLSAGETDELVGLDRDDSCSTYDLAAKFGINRETVTKLPKARGLVVGQQSLSEFEKARIAALRAEGLSANAIGLRIRRDPKTVRAWLNGSVASVDAAEDSV